MSEQVKQRKPPITIDIDRAFDIGDVTDAHAIESIGEFLAKLAYAGFVDEKIKIQFPKLLSKSVKESSIDVVKMAYDMESDCINSVMSICNSIMRVAEERQCFLKNVSSTLEYIMDIDKA